MNRIKGKNRMKAHYSIETEINLNKQLINKLTNKNQKR